MLHDPLKQLTTRLRRFSSLADRLKQASRRLSIWRLSLFFVGLVLTAISFDWSGWLSLGIAFVFIGVFALLVKRHQRIRLQQRFCQQAMQLAQSDLARFELDWSGIPEQPFVMHADIRRKLLANLVA